MKPTNYHPGEVIRKYRLIKEWTQPQLADLWPKVSGGTGVYWQYVQKVEYGEKNITDQFTLRKLSELLGIPLWEFGLSGYDPSGRSNEDLDLEATAPRRQVLQLIGVGAVGVIMSIGNTSLSPERFLSQCSASINACWQLMKVYSISFVEDILVEYMPTLESLALNPSRIQKIAASLAVEAKILQIAIASHRFKYAAREIYCTEAAQFAEISEDNRLHMTALIFQGGMYTYFYRQPQRAIGIYESAIPLLNSDTPLHRTSLLSNLAGAYAQIGEESKARDCMEQARAALPRHSGLDLLNQYYGFETSDLDRLEGKMYLALAQTNRGDYIQKAYDAFDIAARKQIMGDRARGQVLILKAEATIGIGDLRHFAECLGQGIRIALDIDSEKLRREATSALHKAPKSWQKEKVYQNLVKQLS